MLRAPIAALTVAMCSGPARPTLPEAPAGRPVTALADLAGRWQATDVDGWTYDLTITADRYHQTIGRTRGGPCEQKGSIGTYEAIYGAPYDPRQWGGTSYGGADVFAVIVSLEHNDCNRDYTGAQLITLASELTDAEVTLRTTIGYGGPQETRRYRRVLAPVAR